eukprot:6492763-Amphidinium_carterae.3
MHLRATALRPRVVEDKEACEVGTDAPRGFGSGQDAAQCPRTPQRAQRLLAMSAFSLSSLLFGADPLPSEDCQLCEYGLPLLFPLPLPLENG